MGAVPSTTSAIQSPTSTTPAAPIQTSPAHYLFNFGDSYSADGFDLSGTWPSQGNALGNPAWPGYTSCNGPNWLGDLITTAPLNTLSYNFAVGGATVDGTICGFPGGINPFTVQATKFTSSALAVSPHPANGRWTGANSVFLIWFGVNDVDLTAGAAPTTPPVINRIMTTYFNTVNQLVAVGAQKFVFLGIPPLYRMPAHQNDTTTFLADVNAKAQSWNSILSSRTKLFNSKHPRAKAAFLDIQPFFNTVLDNPTQYGAPDATCMNYNGVSCLWVDGLHPGQAIHRSVAAGVKALLDASGFFGKAAAVPKTSLKTFVQTAPLDPGKAAYYQDLYEQELHF